MIKLFTGFLIFILNVLVTGIFAQIPNSAYVVNTLGENLSVIKLDEESVNRNAEPLGLYTNQIVIRNEKGYVVNSGDNEIQVIDLVTSNTLKRIDLKNGSNPYAMDFVNDSVAVVSLLLKNEVSIVNVNSGQIIDTIAVGTGPEGVEYYNGKVYVANTGFQSVGNYSDGMVSVIDITDYSVSEIPVGINPQAVAVSPDGDIVVACTGNYADIGPQMDVIDTEEDTVKLSVPVNVTITNVVVSSDRKAYLATFGSSVLVYNLETHTFERDENNPLPGGPGIAVDSENRVFITDFITDSVYVYGSDHQKLNSYLVGDGPLSIALYEANPSHLAQGEAKTFANFILFQNYPNPFNPITSIKFQLFERSRVSVTIYNLLGQKIKTLLDRRMRSGLHEVEWNGRNQQGIAAPSGIYFYKIKSGNSSEIGKMQLIR